MDESKVIFCLLFLRRVVTTRDLSMVRLLFQYAGEIPDALVVVGVD